MAKRGKKSAAELAVVPIEAGLRRPEPPSDLPEQQCEVWRAVVDAEPADLLRTGASQLLLRRLCAHVVNAWRIDLLVERCATADELGDVGEYDKLLSMAERESRAITALARALRLTNQSRYTPQRAGTAGRRPSRGDVPWQNV